MSGLTSTCPRNASGYAFFIYVGDHYFLFSPIVFRNRYDYGKQGVNFPHFDAFELNTRSREPKTKSCFLGPVEDSIIRENDLIKEA